jgi:uncharacterized membrane protein
LALAHRVPVIEPIPEPGYRHYLFPLSFGLLLLAFFAAPWPFAHKAHVALHGLCAQIPSHTLRLGDQPLPFDSRMTGIYGGFLMSGIYLCVKGRFRASGIPSLRSISVLSLFIAAMAVDGTNSLLLDMHMWHPYMPDNRLRLATGLLTGVALAAIVAFLLASTLWRHPNTSDVVVRGPLEILMVVALQAPFAAVCLFGPGFLFAPVVVFLLVAAVGALTSLMLSALVLFRRTDCMFNRPAELQSSAFVALILAVGIMLLFSGGRLLLERFAGPPALT